jgi:hypothetical protein
MASWLLYFAAAGQAVTAVVTLSQLGSMKGAYEKAFAGSSMKGAPDMLVAITAATAVGIGLLLAVGYVVLGLLDGRGKNPARIVTWAVGGVSICCSGANLVADAIGLNSLGGNSGTNAPGARQIQQALDGALPDWYQPVLNVIGVADIAALVTAVVLLALPGANDFFRKPRQYVREPTMPPVLPPTA